MNGDHVGGPPPNDGRVGYRNYISDAEAKAIHRTFLTSAAGFVIIAIIAHILVWNWRPWGGAYLGKGNPTPGVTTSMNTAAPATAANS